MRRGRAWRGRPRHEPWGVLDLPHHGERWTRGTRPWRRRGGAADLSAEGRRGGWRWWPGPGGCGPFTPEIQPNPDAGRQPRPSAVLNPQSKRGGGPSFGGCSPGGGGGSFQSFSEVSPRVYRAGSTRSGRGAHGARTGFMSGVRPPPLPAVRPSSRAGGQASRWSGGRRVNASCVRPVRHAGTRCERRRRRRTGSSIPLRGGTSFRPFRTIRG